MSDSITKYFGKIFFLALAISHSAIASVSLQPSSASEYHYYTPKMDALIKGYGIGTNKSYRVLRFEDIAFLNEAILEFNFKTRYIWPESHTRVDDYYPVDHSNHHIINTFGRVIEQLENTIRQGQGQRYIDITNDGKIPYYISPDVEFNLNQQVNSSDINFVYRLMTGLTVDRAVDISTLWVVNNNRNSYPKADKICSLYSSIERFHKLRNIGPQMDISIFDNTLIYSNAGTNIVRYLDYNYDWEEEQWEPDIRDTDSPYSGVQAGLLGFYSYSYYSKFRRTTTDYQGQTLVSDIGHDKTFRTSYDSYSSLSNSPVTLICSKDHLDHCGHGGANGAISSVRRISLLSFERTVQTDSSSETTTTKYYLVDTTKSKRVVYSNSYNREKIAMPYLDSGNGMIDFIKTYIPNSDGLITSFDEIEAPPDPSNPDDYPYRKVICKVNFLWSIQIVGINYFTLFDGL